MSSKETLIWQQIRQGLIWQQLDNTDIDWLLKVGKLQEISAGKVLIQQGEPVTTFYIVLQGNLSLVVAGLEGKSQEVAKASNSDIVGEMSCLDNHPAPVTALVLESAQVLSISKQQLMVKLKQDKGFSCRFYRAIALLLSQRLRGVSDLLARSQILPGQPLRKVLLVFGELLDSDISWMSKTGIGKKISADTILLTQGDPSQALYILLEGTLTVSLNIIQGETKINKEIAKLSSGEMVGEMSFLDSSNASATVTAAESCFVFSISRDYLAEKLQKDLSFAARFYRAIAIVLFDRLRDRLMQRGYGKQTFQSDECLDENMEYEDELDMDILNDVSLAATRFDWLVKEVRCH